MLFLFFVVGCPSDPLCYFFLVFSFGFYLYVVLFWLSRPVVHFQLYLILANLLDCVHKRTVVVLAAIGRSKSTAGTGAQTSDGWFKEMRKVVATILSGLGLRRGLKRCQSNKQSFQVHIVTVLIKAKVKRLLEQSWGDDRVRKASFRFLKKKIRDCQTNGKLRLGGRNFLGCQTDRDRTE